jgi:hypothetical protein
MLSKNRHVLADEGKAVRRRGGADGFAVSLGGKKNLRGRNNPSALSLVFTRRASPPAPHPQSPGVGTPAALAVGVHSFQGTAAAVVEFGQRKMNSVDRHLPASGLAQFGIRV